MLQEHVYYRMYLELILATEEFEIFFNLYSKLVPHVTIPEPAVMNAILEALKLHPAQTAMQYIPKLWSHMIMFGHLDREELLENILHLMSVHCKPAPDSSLNAQFAEMALTVWDHIQVIKIIFNYIGCFDLHSNNRRFSDEFEINLCFASDDTFIFSERLKKNKNRISFKLNRESIIKIKIASYGILFS